MPKIRIGIVCHPSIGGSGLVATELGLGLAELGHEVHFISSVRPFKLIEDSDRLFFHSVEAINYPLFSDPLYTFALTAKIVEVVEQFKLDIVHAHYSIPHSLCAYLAGEITTHKFPTVTTIHGTDVTIVGQDKPLYPLNRFSIHKSTKVTTVSNYQRSYIYSHFDKTKSIDVIHNFIDLAVFSPDLADIHVRRKMAKDDEKIVMHVSNFRPLKNSDTVVRAFYMLQRKVKARLVLLGSGPDIDSIKLQCKKLGILKHVTFMGDVTHVEHYLPNADCMIQPSYRESFSMVLLEAMACAVPTVSSNVDGIPEVVDNGQTGFMFDPDDAVGMAKAMTQILTEPQKQAQMGLAGRSRAAKLFNPKDKITQYLACYEEAINDCQSSLQTREHGEQHEQ
ncbi:MULTISPECIES: N-acetyl-alpha-D-glucosaminyl L-malate synthase BshA [unclassified Shewanella]|uniref:N-acetyl-alpha-D-glucosaminyl L-malate synthase BshA n=1 Tax=unclassified Shewanella TaxID=196818 RepID=UPI001BC663E4|nr:MULTISPECIES: N-acetyl-alpha-D-glucosaminyl L-malate synthase BshA [unclassified Shewanella]MCG9729137.1 N-acetyl-alpha-D-glucosaminyl L-malate synthase BshA [Shewanella sp. Isolate13]GIU13146.1 N-acetyl-alpha-D-glucosaminyl L-malate synthase BshA [Shewanella sp. MBTL60-007]